MLSKLNLFYFFKGTEIRSFLGGRELIICWFRILTFKMADPDPVKKKVQINNKLGKLVLSTCETLIGYAPPLKKNYLYIT